MQSRPNEFLQRSPEIDSPANATSTQHGRLSHDGSPNPAPVAPGLDAGAEASQDAVARTAAHARFPACERDERDTTSGMSGRRSGKRTPSPVDKIIEHERASPKYTPGKDKSPGFRVISRSKNAPPSRISLHHLPAEVLTHVCSYLPADAFSSMALVSKRVHQIVTGEHAWRMAFARYFPGHEALNENPTVKLDRAGEEVLTSEKRYFTRLSALSSWRSEYIIRTRMLRALGRGSPSEVDNLTGYVGSRAHLKATRVGQMDYSGGLSTPITKIVGSFSMKNNRPQVRLLHASKEECSATMSRPLESNKHIEWGFEIPRLQFYEVQPSVEMYGMGSGEVVGVPNSYDISPLYGLLVADGMPGGRVYHRHVQEERGVLFARSVNDGAPEKGIPRVNESNESMTAVWIAKNNNIPEITNGLICALVGSSAGIVTACSLGSPVLTGGTRTGAREISARWVLSPGVPIIAFGIDEQFSARRLEQGRTWAFALNALGEVFYLKEIPQMTPTPLPENHRNPSDWDLNVLTWDTGRSVHWELVEPTRRSAKPDPFGDASANATYSPRSSSLAQGLSNEQLAAETKEIQTFIQQPPSHYRATCDGWDMQRQFEVDFAGDDEHGAGEAIFVINCGLQEGRKASVDRFTRLLIEDVVHAPETSSPVRKPSPPPKVTSLFGGIPAAAPTESAWNVTKPVNVRRISYSSASDPVPEERFEVWRASTFTFGGLKAVQITASAKDESTYAGFTIGEDPLLSLNPIPTAWSPSASPIGRSQRFGHATDVPGQRARLLAIGTKIGSVVVWNMRAPTSSTAELINDVEPVRIIHTDSPGISSLALSALYVVHGGADGLIQAWDPLAHESEPVRTLHSKFAQKARRDLRNNQARPLGVGINFYAASAICLDPDAKTLRGVASIGTHLRYWSYSSGSAGAYRGSKRRSQRDRIASNQGTDPKVTRTGRGVLADYIANEQADLERARRDREKETERANARYGLNLLGDGATEDEIMAYATMISEETHASDEARRMSGSNSSASSLTTSPGLRAAGSSSIADEPDSEDVQLARALQDADEDLAEALKRSMRETSASYAPEMLPEPEPEPADLGFTVKFAKSKKGRRSPKGKTPLSAASPALSGASRDSGADDLEYALQLSLAEEQSRREVEEQFPSLRQTSSSPGSAGGKGKRRAWS